MRIVHKIVIVLLLISCFCVHASATSFSFQDETIIGKNDGLKISKAEPFDPLGHFIYKENLLPGDTIRKTYAISNSTKNYYKLSMKSQNPTSLQKDKNGNLVDDNKDLIHQIKLVLKLDGEIVYSGSADGYDELTGKNVLLNDGFIIGDIPNTTLMRLDVEFIIPETLDNRYIEAEAQVEWVFEGVLGERDSNVPITSDTSQILLFILMFFSSLFAILVLLRRYKKPIIS